MRVPITVKIFDQDPKYRDSTVLQCAHVVLKPDEVRHASISIGEPSMWENERASDAFRVLRWRWFRGDPSPFERFVQGTEDEVQSIMRDVSDMNERADLRRRRVTRAAMDMDRRGRSP